MQHNSECKLSYFIELAPKGKKNNSLNVIPTFQQTNAKQKSTTFRDSA